MNEPIPESWQIFVEQYPQFTKVHRELAKMAWFAEDGWSAYIGYYHAGIYMQVYKYNWFNHGLDGIHFETGMTAESLQNKRLQLDLHVGHRNLFDRARFNELTIPRMHEVVSSWGEGYHFSKKNLSDRLHVVIPFTKSGFAKQVAGEFARLCSLAPIIDEGLAGLS